MVKFIVVLKILINLTLGQSYYKILKGSFFFKKHFERILIRVLKHLGYGWSKNKMGQIFKGLPTKQKWAYLRTKMMMGAVGLSVTIDYYGLIWSYSVSFGLILSIRSYSVYFIRICSIQSYSVHFGLIRLLGSIWSVCPLWSYLSNLVLFSPFCPLWSHSV